MKSTKKLTTKADLPAKIEGGYQGTEGPGQLGTPPKGGSAAKRPSRSKAAVAERERAVAAYAYRTDGVIMHACDTAAQAEGFIDHKAALADAASWAPEPVADHPLVADRAAVVAYDVKAILKAIAAGFTDRDTILATVPDDVREAFLDAELDQAIAGLDDEPEVVRSLSDLDFGSADAVDVGPDALTVLRQITDELGHAEWAAPQHAEDILGQLIANYHTSAKAAIERALAATKSKPMTASSAPFNIIDARFYKGDVFKLPVSDDTYSTLTSQHDRILELEGKLDAATVELAQAEELTKVALHDHSQKCRVAEAQAATIAELNARIAREEQSHLRTIDQREEYLEWADKLAHAIGGADIGEHSSANSPWENALDIAYGLKTDLARKQSDCSQLGGWLAEKTADVRTLTDKVRQQDLQLASIRAQLSDEQQEVDDLRTEVARLSGANMDLASRGFVARVLNRGAPARRA